MNIITYPILALVCICSYSNPNEIITVDGTIIDIIKIHCTSTPPTPIPEMCKLASVVNEEKCGSFQLIVCQCLYRNKKIVFSIQNKIGEFGKYKKGDKIKLRLERKILDALFAFKTTKTTVMPLIRIDKFTSITVDK